MPPIEIGPTRPVGAVQARTVGTETVQAGTARPQVAASAALQVQTSDAVKAGNAPVDAERVATIRKAIEQGSYPVIPTKIADAMIAAGMLLRSPQ